MDKDKRNPIKKIALSAILSALGVIFLAIGSIINILDLSSAAIAGFVIVISVIEIQGKYPVLTYLVISIVSVLILPDKLPSVFFIFFAGFYPIFKAYIERFHYILAWVVKFSLFNIILAIMIWTVKFLSAKSFLPSLDNMTFFNYFKENFKFIVFVIANITFLLYDIAMTRIITLYIIKIRKLLKLKNYF
ncbi:MAG: hypothetical protein FWD71_07275 [Oscillospiraceae bacterium]|nr:hypothetical protein [Oscillospiraceae bacterium]